MSLSSAASRYASCAAAGAPLRKRRKENVQFRSSTAWLRRGGSAGEVMAERALAQTVAAELAQAIADVAALENAIAAALAEPVGAEPAADGDDDAAGLRSLGQLAKLRRKEAELEREICATRRRGEAKAAAAATGVAATVPTPTPSAKCAEAAEMAAAASLAAERAHLARTREAAATLRRAAAREEEEALQEDDAAAAGDDAAAEEEADKTIVFADDEGVPLATSDSERDAARRWLAEQSALTDARTIAAHADAASADAARVRLEQQLCVLARSLVTAAAGGRDVAAVSARLLKAVLREPSVEGVDFADATKRVPDRTLALAALHHLETLHLLTAAREDDASIQKRVLRVGF